MVKLFSNFFNSGLLVLVLIITFMMSQYDKVDSVISNTLVLEGGFANNPRDPGGVTNFGITLNTYKSLVNKTATVNDLKAISANEARQFYRTYFFYKYNMQTMPENVWDVVFDMAVNHGPVNAVNITQNALNKLGYSVQVTGMLDKATVQALTTANEENSEALRRGILAQRVSFYNAIIRRKPSQRVFAATWFQRCSKFVDSNVLG